MSGAVSLVDVKAGCLHLNRHSQKLFQLLLGFIDRQVDAIEAGVRTREYRHRLGDGVYGKLPDISIIALQTEFMDE